MKRIALLGATGSIGKNCLDVIRRLRSQFRVVTMTTNNNTEILAEQAEEFRPTLCAVMDPHKVDDLQDRLSERKIQIRTGPEGLLEAATHPDTDLVVNALVGAVGLIPTIRAIEAGKDVALANKESLVMAGEFIMNLAQEKKVQIIPVDSEHSGIMQCLHGNRREDVARIILTASGGPFFNRRAEEFQSITPQQALEHPTWNMGPKITVDSATLMNKGLEVIEAHWLFGVPISHIEVTIHKQSIIHSLVEFTDGSILAQIGPTDMRLPIQIALTFPERMESPYPRVRFEQTRMLTFEKPDHEKFPCLRLAYKAAQDGGTTPAVLNAANEIAVQAFLENRISFEKIPSLIEETTTRHVRADRPSLNEILTADRWARGYVMKQLP
ncbi:MAG: 1-deoxy-D-xylulose-5-phosphate reductoisomerase [Gemmatimonadota bacterium]|nr:MAG: 1-deoxy-D-xylulose-5-phosphate reductoisomerase [Gemmatimonadota bacterium]